MAVLSYIGGSDSIIPDSFDNGYSHRLTPICINTDKAFVPDDDDDDAVW